MGTLLYTAQVDRRKGNMQTKRFVHIFGVQRSVFMNALNELKEDGIIDYSTHEITILDREKLKAILTTDDDD